jgi:uncharacterized membrane protein
MTVLISPTRERARLQAEECRRCAINVAPAERVLSGLVGGGLIYLGIRRWSSLLGLGMMGVGAAMLQRGWSGHCAMYQRLGISSAQEAPATPEQYFQRGTQAAFSVTIDKPPAELYRFWRDFNNLPRFMENLKRIEVIDEKRSHWVVEGPGGYELEWDAEIINDEPEHLVAWRTLGRSDVAISGSVRFLPAPGNRGTEVHVVADYIPPGGKLGVAAAKLFGKDAQAQIKTNLRRFKQLMETGEIPTAQGQPRGTCKT